jgi:membrane protein required for colicin V production
MRWIDIVIILIVLCSAVIGGLRGFVKEAVALITWIAAIWLAVAFSQDLAAWFPQSLGRTTFTLGGTAFEVRNIHIGIAFIIVVVATLTAGATINYLLAKVTKAQMLRGTDHILGLIFGVTRGAAIVGILVLAAGLTKAPETDWWQQAMLIPPFELGAGRVLELLPPDIAQHFSYAGQV